MRQNDSFDDLVKMINQKYLIDHDFEVYGGTSRFDVESEIGVLTLFDGREFVEFSCRFDDDKDFEISQIELEKIEDAIDLVMDGIDKSQPVRIREFLSPIKHQRIGFVACFYNEKYKILDFYINDGVDTYSLRSLADEEITMKVLCEMRYIISNFRSCSKSIKKMLKENKNTMSPIYKNDDLWNYNVVVITTNGYVSPKTRCAVMGRGCAKQALDRYPNINRVLGKMIQEKGNHVHFLGRAKKDGKYLISFPVKPDFVIYDGSNVVKHMANRFKVGDRVPGWAAKADIRLIEQSPQELVALIDRSPFKEIAMPRPGCGAGELDFSDVKKLLDKYLDDRYLVLSK